MSLSDLDMHALAKRATDYRTSKDFVAADWDLIPTKLACIFSELEELNDALEGEGLVHYEIADVAMYTLALLSDIYGTEWSTERSFMSGERRHASAADLLRPIRKHVRKALEAWRWRRELDLRHNLEFVLLALEDLRDRILKIPGTLADCIEAKLTYAAHRLPLHGGKDPRS